MRDKICGIRSSPRRSPRKKTPVVAANTGKKAVENAANKPEAAPIRDESDAAPIRDEPDEAPIRDKPEAASIRDEPEAAPIRDEHEAPIPDEPEAVIPDEPMEAAPFPEAPDDPIPDEPTEAVGVLQEPEPEKRRDKRKKKKQKMQDDGVLEEENDCEVVGDEDCNDVWYANEGDRIGVHEEQCEDFVAEFGEAAREMENAEESDADSGDDIWDDERIPEPLSHSDDEEAPEDDGVVPTEAEDPEELLRLGKTFNSPEDFKIAVLRYSLKTRYDIKLYRSQSLKIGAKCCDTDVKCQWRCYCSYDKKKHKMQVKIYEDGHICVRSGYTKMLRIGTIAWLFSERLRKNPKMTKQEMVDEVKREYNLTVTEDQCAKAKTKVMRERKATHEDHFARIWNYQAEVFKKNPGTTFDIETTPGPTIGSLQRFFRLFICFKSQRDTWKHTCRPIIGIDGAFIKWDVKGHLLAATGRDGDNRIVPIAWAIVEIENDDNWDWFVRKLAVNLDLQDGRNVAIISDKQSGLVKAIHSVVPEAEHRQCARHIMENWKRNSHDMELQRLFWKIARSYTEGEMNGHMQELKKYNPSAFDSLVKTNPRTWSRAFFRIGSCCNDNLNNLSESFNKTIRLARKKPLLDLLEDIRKQCMERNQQRFVVASRLKTRFTKRAHAEIEKMIAGAQFCERWMARHNKHEVRLGLDTFVVDMNENICDCRKWQMTGIPCVHAASVIIGQRNKVEDFVSDWYTTKMWQNTYADGIGPVNGMLQWPIVNRVGVLPPPWRRGNPGRPNNHDRRRSLYETSSTNKNTLSRMFRVMTCSNCKEEGHNKQGCNNQRVTTPPKRKRGRPRKAEEPRPLFFGQGQSWEGSQVQPSQTVSEGPPSQGISQASSQETSQAPSESQRGSIRGVGRGSQRGSIRGVGRGSQRGSGRSSQRGSVRGSGRGSQTQGQGLGPQGQGLEGWGPWFECSN